MDKKKKNNKKKQNPTNVVQYQIVITSQFKKDSKDYVNDIDVQEKLKVVMDRLLNGERLDKYTEYRDHILVKGQWKGLNDCHLKPDLVLLYRRSKQTKGLIYFERIGHHAKLGLND